MPRECAGQEDHQQRASSCWVNSMLVDKSSSSLAWQQLAATAWDVQSQHDLAEQEDQQRHVSNLLTTL